MTWYLIKGFLVVFGVFIAMALIGNFIGIVQFSLYKNARSFEKYSIRISFIIGMLSFIIMGMFLASFAYSLVNQMSLWLSVSLTLFFVLSIHYLTYKETREMTVRRMNRQASEINNLEIHHIKNTFSKHSQIINQNVLNGYIALLPSCIFFLIFNSLADKFSFGLNSYLLNLIK